MIVIMAMAMVMVRKWTRISGASLRGAGGTASEARRRCPGRLSARLGVRMRDGGGYDRSYQRRFPSTSTSTSTSHGIDTSTGTNTGGFDSDPCCTRAWFREEGRRNCRRRVADLHCGTARTHDRPCLLQGRLRNCILSFTIRLGNARAPRPAHARLCFSGPEPEQASRSTLGEQGSVKDSILRRVPVPVPAPVPRAPLTDTLGHGPRPSSLNGSLPLRVLVLVVRG